MSYKLTEEENIIKLKIAKLIDSFIKANMNDGWYAPELAEKIVQEIKQEQMERLEGLRVTINKILACHYFEMPFEAIEKAWVYAKEAELEELDYYTTEILSKIQQTLWGEELAHNQREQREEALLKAQLAKRNQEIKEGLESINGKLHQPLINYLNGENLFVATDQLISLIKDALGIE